MYPFLMMEFNVLLVCEDNVISVLLLTFLYPLSGGMHRNLSFQRDKGVRPRDPATSSG